jgi:hypothetical protein
MRKYFRALALLPRAYPEWSNWFCVWSAERRCLDFIAGEPSGNESFRQCVQRCVQQTLGLPRNSFLVSNMAQLNMETAMVLPGECDPHHLAVSFYLVNLYREVSRSTVEAFPRGRWLSNRELLAGESADGEPVSPVLTHLLRRTEVIQAHQST